MSEKIIKSRTYTLTIDELDNGKNRFTRENNGFTPFELVGLLTYAKDEITAIIDGDLKVDEVVRIKVVKEDEK